MNRPSINMDAQWLREFVLTQHGLKEWDIARLLHIAEHIESMDEKLATSQHTPLDFDKGVIVGEARVYSRSNMPLSETLPPTRAKIILEALASTSVPVKKIPKGVRALDINGKPLEEEKPKAKPKANKFAHLNIEVDL